MPRNQRFRTLLALTAVGVCVAAVTLFLGSRPSDEHLEPYLCLDSLDLKEMITAEGLEPQPQPWGVLASRTTTKNTVFEGEQETALTLADPDAFVGEVCKRLRSQLVQRCEVTTFRQGQDYCAASLRSPDRKITGPDGHYIFRAMAGQINLLSEKLPDGKTQLVLQSLEWRD